MIASLDIVQQACGRAGRSAEGAEPIRIAENAIWRLPGGVVARVTPDPVAARRELRIARWFAEHGVSAVRPAADEVVEVDERAVTFWQELPPHRMGDCMNMAALLRQVHDLPVPDFLGPIDPFEALLRRAHGMKCVSGEDRDWLFVYIDELRDAWRTLPDGLPWCVVHGDAWSGNCAVSVEDGKAYLLDFDLVSLGPPEWDLTAIATALSVGGKLTPREYKRFCEAYGGTDVLEWAGYGTTRSIRELIMTTWCASVADVRPEWRPEVQYRVDCLRGKKGPRPWRWTAIH